MIRASVAPSITRRKPSAPPCCSVRKTSSLTAAVASENGLGSSTRPYVLASTGAPTRLPSRDVIRGQQRRLLPGHCHQKKCQHHYLLPPRRCYHQSPNSNNRSHARQSSRSRRSISLSPPLSRDRSGLTSLLSSLEKLSQLSRSSSTKPLYDFSHNFDEDEEDTDYHLDFNDFYHSKGHSKWKMEMDNVSKYDNFSQYGSSSSSHRPFPSEFSSLSSSTTLSETNSESPNYSLPNQSGNEEISLLSLLKNDMHQSSTYGQPSESLSSARQASADILEDRGEESLLSLLNRGDNDGNDSERLELANNSLLDEKLSGWGMSPPNRQHWDQELDLNQHSPQYQQYQQQQPMDESSMLNLVSNQLEEDESLLELLEQKQMSPHSISELQNDQQKYEKLQKIQLQLEIESTEEALQKNVSIWNSARTRADHATLPAVRSALNSWYGPLTDAIELEQWLYLNGDNSTSSAEILSAEIDNSDEDADSDLDDTENTSSSQNEGNNTNTRRKRNEVRDRTMYGPLLCLLPPQKIAVILAHSALSAAMTDGDKGSTVVALALAIARNLETEVNVSRALRVRALKRGKQENVNVGGEFGMDENEDGEELSGNGDGTEQMIGISEESQKKNNSNSDFEVSVDKWIYTATHLQRFLDEISGEGTGGVSGEQKSLNGKGRVRPELVRKRCEKILNAEGFFLSTNSQDDNSSSVENSTRRKMTMNDFVEWDSMLKVKLGAALIRILLNHTTYSTSQRRNEEPEPAFSYERKNIGKMRFKGFVTMNPDLLNIALNDEVLPDSNFGAPLSMQNTRCQPMVVPPKEWVDVNDGGYETIKVDLMRTRQCRFQKAAIRNADLTKVFDGLNVLGRIPWKINPIVLEAAWKCWDEGIPLGDIPPREDYEVPPKPDPVEYVDFNSLDDDAKKERIQEFRTHKEKVSRHFRFKQKNMDLHSLRCSAMLKLNQAKKFKDFDEVFFPYNLDFRGRAYPVPPHLSIVGSDLCRALLVFSQSKPLGPNGLYWLKVHLANLAGANKMSFDGRASFADENMDNIRAAVNDPFGENRWWMDFDDPFQGLATCHEIIKAIDSGDPASYMCSLPVHMDGSCNGLQHYAALGRDTVGGKAVNLCVADEPQDVYIGVMHEVIRRVALDAEEQLCFDESKENLSKLEKEQLKKVKSARLVNGLIDRGVVKRTVMTSVYGVTYIGARNQISEKIEEKLEEKGFDIDEIESEIHTACGYLASLTMEVMGQLFIGARQTMNWLTACAKLISAQGQPVAWVSPIGVPIVQPYRQKRPFTVVTLLQNVVLTTDSDTLPLHRTRQVSAFPPNYVHSLDSSHMLLTAIEMQKRGLHFSAVHDSYWTHPCDIEEMNVVLRDCFVDLYNQPLLEELKSRWELRYPSLTFPDVPTRGDLDLNDVRSAPYFFQ